MYSPPITFSQVLNLLGHVFQIHFPHTAFTQQCGHAGGPLREVGIVQGFGRGSAHKAILLP